MKRDKMNYSLFMAAQHLLEAGKHMSYFNQDKAARFMMEADAILAVIEPVEEKVADEKLENIMDEIMSFGEKK